MNDFKDFRDIFASFFGNAPKGDEPKSEEERLAVSKAACERKCAITNAQEGNINAAQSARIAVFSTSLCFVGITTMWRKDFANA